MYTLRGCFRQPFLKSVHSRCCTAASSLLSKCVDTPLFSKQRSYPSSFHTVFKNYHIFTTTRGINHHRTEPKTSVQQGFNPSSWKRERRRQRQLSINFFTHNCSLKRISQVNIVKEVIESCRSDQFFGSRYLLLQIVYLTQSHSLLFSRAILDIDISSLTAPRVNPLAWEEEAAEERVQQRA